MEYKIKEGKERTQKNDFGDARMKWKLRRGSFISCALRILLPYENANSTWSLCLIIRQIYLYNVKVYSLHQLGQKSSVDLRKIFYSILVTTNFFIISIFNRCQHNIIGNSDVFFEESLNFSLCAIFHLIAPHFKAYSCRKTFHYIGYIPCFKSIWWETKEFALIRIFEHFWTTINSLFWHAINISCHTNFMLHHRVILYCKFEYWTKNLLIGMNLILSSWKATFFIQNTWSKFYDTKYQKTQMNYLRKLIMPIYYRIIESHIINDLLISIFDMNYIFL